MKKREVLDGIAKELENLASEKLKDFYYAIDLYADDYDKDSVRALILKWEQSGYGNFDEIFPVTVNVVTKLEQVNDGVERPREVYADIIASAKDALKEVREYKIS